MTIPRPPAAAAGSPDSDGPGIVCCGCARPIPVQSIPACDACRQAVGMPPRLTETDRRYLAWKRDRQPRENIP